MLGKVLVSLERGESGKACFCGGPGDSSWLGDASHILRLREKHFPEGERNMGLRLPLEIRRLDKSGEEASERMTDRVGTEG